MTQRIDQIGDTTVYIYDDLHRLIERDYSTNGGSPTYPATQGPDTFTYDRAGRMLTATRAYNTDPSVEIAITTDAAGRVTQWTTDGRAIAYTYAVDASTNRTEITYPGGRVIRHDFDQRDRTVTIGNVGSVTLATNTYDLVNRIIHRDFNASETSAYCDWTYDAAGRCSSVIHRYVPPAIGDTPSSSSDPIIAGANYTRDAVGNPLVREDVQDATHSEVYWYDAADRLTDFKRGTLNTNKDDVATYTSDANLKQRQQWTLDALGNWNQNPVRQNGVTLTETRTHNKANEYLASSGSGLPSITFAHDDNGNLTDDGTYLHEYDIENRLTRVKLKSNSDAIAVYTYDALGRRVKKVITNSGSLNGTFHEVHSPDWQLLEIRHDAGTNELLDQEFVHAAAAAPAGGSQLTTRSSGLGYIDDHIALYRVSGSSLYYYHQDAQ